jgi:phosphoglycolate phosphatase-like HAD superfamily hydrolase
VEKFMNLKAVVFDLDNTLINAERVKWFFRRLAEAHGFTDDEAKEIYRLARNHNTGEIAISDERFIQFLEMDLIENGKQLDHKIVEETFKEISENKKELVFAGAEELVEFCKENNWSHYLLSLGVEKWQKKKIAWAGLNKFFNDENTVFTVKENGGKREALQDLFGKDFTGKEVVLFNDRPDESGELLNFFPDLIIFVCRNLQDVRHSEDDWKKFAEKYSGRVVMANSLLELFLQFKEYVAEFK